MHVLRLISCLLAPGAERTEAASQRFRHTVDQSEKVGLRLNTERASETDRQTETEADTRTHTHAHTRTHTHAHARTRTHTLSLPVQALADAYQASRKGLATAVSSIRSWWGSVAKQVQAASSHSSGSSPEDGARGEGGHEQAQHGQVALDTADAGPTHMAVPPAFEDVGSNAAKAPGPLHVIDDDDDGDGDGDDGHDHDIGNVTDDGNQRVGSGNQRVGSGKRPNVA